LELQNSSPIERLFNACAVLHNMSLDYDGIVDWENHTQNVRFNAADDTCDVTSFNIQHIQMMDDILFNKGGASSSSFSLLIICASLNFTAVNSWTT
jgi:hypothetical protein